MSKSKKAAIGVLTTALVGGTVDMMNPQEYVQWSDPLKNEMPAKIIKSSQLNKFAVNSLTDDIIEPVVHFKAFQKWTCQSCTQEGAQPPTDLQKPDWGIEKVKALEAQRIQDGKSVKVCVVDTGVDLNHPDLKFISGRNFTSGAVSAFGDDNGHGSHTAGLVGAVNNSIGVVGSSQAQLIIAKVLDRNGSGTNESIANGVVWCARAGAKIISMSLGGPTPSNILYRAMGYASQQGVISYVAAGNEGNNRPNYPAAFNVPRLYAISALDQNNQKAQFSSYGPHIDYAAPGVDINSTVPGGYKRYSGTSMATPIVAGVAAICLAAKKPIKAIPLGDKIYFGAGIPDAMGCVQ